MMIVKGASGPVVCFIGVKGMISYYRDGFFQQGPVFAEDKHQGPAPQQGEPLGAQDAAEPGEPGDAAGKAGAQGGAEAASAGQNEPSARGEGRIRGNFFHRKPSDIGIYSPIAELRGIPIPYRSPADY